MKRRKILTTIGLCALAVPLGAFGQQQQGKVWRIGFLSQRDRPKSLDSDTYGAFPRGMRELGYVEGKNLVMEWRFAEKTSTFRSGRVGQSQSERHRSSGRAARAAQKRPQPSRS
jgi:putative ABC transport system substrate-binding protein